MARFSESLLNRIAQANDIVEVVGQYVALRKRGREFVGLCPFHDDHKPSMTVSPAKQIYKCFVCGAGGGVFQFLMQYEKRTFTEAVETLAGRAGVPLPKAETPPGVDSSEGIEGLLKVTTFAARYFRERLGSEAGADALAYARRRRLSDASIRRFGLGFAPDAWEALRSAARGAGFTDRQLVSAGLVARREDGGCYDRFRNRLMFPIIDVAGRVIAFGGRALDEQDRAKYLNSPETVLFDKSAQLYALNWSRQAIVDAGQAVVVEGYLDALMCLQEGVGNVAATLGTALTDRHVRLLGRYAREVVLVFDADAAGQAAAERAIELFLTQRMNVRVAGVPASPAGEGAEAVKDPCDYVLAAGAEAMRDLLARAPDALEYAWSRRRDAYRRAPALADKRSILEEFLTLVVSSVSYGAIDALRLGLVVDQIAGLVGVPPQAVGEQVRRLSRRVRRAGAAGQDPPPADPAETTGRAERWLLGILLNQPALLDRLGGRIHPGMFATPLLKALAEQVWRLAGEDRLDLPTLLGMPEAQQWGRLVTDIQVDAEKRGDYERTLQDAADDILRRHRRGELEQLRDREGPLSTDFMRRISREGRKPDPRRRPRIS